MFGLYDTQDNLWLGDTSGPKLFEDALVARVAAQIADRSLHQPMGRTRALPFVASYVRLRDEVPVLTDAATALKQLEEGS